MEEDIGVRESIIEAMQLGVKKIIIVEDIV